MGRDKLILRPLALYSFLDLPLHLGPHLTCFPGAAVSISARKLPLPASLGQCLGSAPGLGWAVLVSWASIRGPSHTLSSALRHRAQWVHRRCLCPTCWDWVMATPCTRPWEADWAQASRTLGEREEPTPKAVRARALWPSPALASALW